MSRPPASAAIRTAVAGCPHLTALPAGALESVVDSTWMRTLAADEAVYRAGDPGDAMFVVASGRIVTRLSSSEGAAVDLAVASEGALFGYLEVLAGGPRSADAVALTPSRVVVFGAAVASRLLLTCPALVLSLARDMVGIIRAHRETAREQAFSAVPNRLARFLIEAADADGRILLDGPQVLVAQRLGIARQTLNRALRRLSTGDLVRVEPTGRVITIVDRAGLHALARAGGRHRQSHERAFGGPDRRAGNGSGYTTENPGGRVARPVSAASTAGPVPSSTATRAARAADSASTDGGNTTGIPVAAAMSPPCTASSNVRVGR
jgi:CRP-like cAMP-binding protein